MIKEEEVYMANVMNQYRRACRILIFLAILCAVSYDILLILYGTQTITSFILILCSTISAITVYLVQRYLYFTRTIGVFHVLVFCTTMILSLLDLIL